MVLWVKSYTSIGNHPKTRKLAGRLDISTPEAVGLLHLLWHWALEYSEDGDLSKHDAEDLAVGAHFDGEPDTFLKALVAAGYVDQTDAGLVLHDWNDYAGRWLATRRALSEAGKRGAQSRWGDGSADGRAIATPMARPMARTDKSRGERDKPSEGESEGESQPKNQDPLVARLIAVCTGKRVDREALAVLAHLRRHVDDRLIDEAIGYCAKLNDPPKLPRYLVEVVRGDARKHGITVPTFDPKARP